MTVILLLVVPSTRVDVLSFLADFLSTEVVAATSRFNLHSQCLEEERLQVVPKPSCSRHGLVNVIVAMHYGMFSEMVTTTTVLLRGLHIGLNSWLAFPPGIPLYLCGAPLN